MKRNQNFDHNHSQKVLSRHYSMDTNRGSGQNWTGYLYNKPLEYTQLVLSGEIEHYLSLGCDHGRLED